MTYPLIPSGSVEADALLNGYTETGVAATSSAGNLTCNLDGRPKHITLTENISAWTLNEPTAPECGGCKLSMIQGATDYTVGWPPAWYWPDGNPAVMPTGSGSVLSLMLDSTSDGRIEARAQVMSQ